MTNELNFHAANKHHIDEIARLTYLVAKMQPNHIPLELLPDGWRIRDLFFKDNYFFIEIENERDALSVYEKRETINAAFMAALAQIKENGNG